MTNDSVADDQSLEVNVPTVAYDFSVKMSEHLVLALIDSVRRHPCLWQTTHVNYRSRSMRKAAWKEIAAETGLTEDVAAMKYQYMRDHFVRKMNGYPATEEAARKWQYFRPLFFLRDEVLKKRGIDKAVSTTRSSGKRDLNLLTADESLVESDDNQPLSVTATALRAETGEAVASIGGSAPKRLRTGSAVGDGCSLKENSSNVNGQQQETPSTSTSAAITERYVNTLESLVYQRLAVCQTEETEEQHMGKMIEQRLSQYPRKLRSKIIVKIMQIFHEADEELEEQQNAIYAESQ